MFQINVSCSFRYDYNKITSNNFLLKKRIKKAIKLLAKDPFHPSLNSHKVYAKNIGFAWSSRITGDIRMIWEYNFNNTLAIDLLALGSHSGKYRVYN